MSQLPAGRLVPPRHLPSGQLTFQQVIIAEILICLLVFSIVAAVRHGLTAEWDRWVLISFRNQEDLSRGIGPVWLAETVRDITGLGSTAVLAAVITTAAGFMLAARLWRSFATLMLTVASAEAVCLALKWAVYRPRPSIIPGAPQVFTLSFPSSHAMISLVTYFLLAALLSQRTDRLGLRVYTFATAVLLTLIVGVSRIYLGVHWPTDVIAGWAAGLAWVLLCWTLASRWCWDDARQLP